MGLRKPREDEDPVVPSAWQGAVTLRRACDYA